MLEFYAPVLVTAAVCSLGAAVFVYDAYQKLGPQKEVAPGPVPSIYARLLKGEGGVPLPVLEVRYARGTPKRLVSATVHEVAAKVERALKDDDTWVVFHERFADESGRVALTLVQGSEEEIARAMAVLRGIAANGPSGGTSGPSRKNAKVTPPGEASKKAPPPKPAPRQGEP